MVNIVVFIHVDIVELAYIVVILVCKYYYYIVQIII